MGFGRLDVFARGQHNKLWQRTYDKGWSGWMSHAGCELVGGPAAVSWGLGCIDVLSMTFYGDLIRKYQCDSVWHP